MMENFNSKKILANIKNDLFPVVNPFMLLPRILGIHILATLFVMSICPQFGLGIFKNSFLDLTGLFMQVSHEFCQMMCGLLLTSLSTVVIWGSLKVTEKEWLMQNKFISAGIILSLTSAFFWMQAPEIHLIEFILWTAGSLVGLTSFRSLSDNVV